ncbi:hypothetical protein NDU88_002847 [Pleurodeles waltl]|uniref:Uncharacterized protein n=1 Tax=Pleurodeles waltl TaxID=8319 RepID=A0AAV7MC86_PLEWA|nr:hypothetical protein NDU88_002847 [Pleurodeles waltl]
MPRRRPPERHSSRDGKDRSLAPAVRSSSWARGRSCERMNENSEFPVRRNSWHAEASRTLGVTGHRPAAWERRPAVASYATLERPACRVGLPARPSDAGSGECACDAVSACRQLCVQLLDFGTA